MNPRPPGYQPGAIARLSYGPIYHSIPTFLLVFRLISLPKAQLCEFSEHIHLSMEIPLISPYPTQSAQALGFTVLADIDAVTFLY